MTPHITVVTRLVPGEAWPNGYPIHCVKYGQDKYSSMYKIEETYKEEVIYQGSCPANLRILPYVDHKYLFHYMTFFSQIIPKNIDPKVAAAVRHTCWDKIFDSESYLPGGKIISWTPNTNHSQEVQDYLSMFLKQEDFDRIKKWGDIGIENWNSETYSKVGS